MAATRASCGVKSWFVCTVLHTPAHLLAARRGDFQKPFVSVQMHCSLMHLRSYRSVKLDFYWPCHAMRSMSFIVELIVFERGLSGDCALTLVGQTHFLEGQGYADRLLSYFSGMMVSMCRNGD